MRRRFEYLPATKQALANRDDLRREWKFILGLEVPLTDFFAIQWYFRYRHLPTEDPPDFSKWIAVSTKHQIAWDGLLILVKTMREYNQPVPPALNEWALDALDGTRKRPRRGKRGVDCLTNIVRDRHIVIHVKGVEVLYGIPATSTNETKPPKPKPDLRSACHFVAEDRIKSYKTVRNIWQSSKWDKVRESVGLYFSTGNKKFLYLSLACPPYWWR